MSWQQPVPGPHDLMVLTEMSHPCVRGCSGWWKLPAAEQAGLVELDGDSAVGNVARVNQHY
ncbi:hypothetical protein ACFFQW_40935 [Umezawaea endophytica]|uniref:Uncharacterized protein n=1 Tax=Umezawaea endophytica TaxID=1654476 RepID=A0A9X3AIA9_9PSEU|nr:hypothetical protein [Umezawaea endophytica]MCS7482852.1 hypothetical protein [Umezawaea endophytica]